MTIEKIGIALRTAFERHRHYNKIRTELEQFNDRELNELGISRSDIHEIARRAAVEEVVVAAQHESVHLHLAKAA